MQKWEIMFNLSYKQQLSILKPMNNNFHCGRNILNIANMLFNQTINCVKLGNITNDIKLQENSNNVKSVFNSIATFVTKMIHIYLIIKRY